MGTTIDSSLWALEIARDEYSDSAYDFQRAQQQVQRLQAERRRLVSTESTQAKGQRNHGTQK